MTGDARNAVKQLLRILGGTIGKDYRERSDLIHGAMRMANHLLPVDDYPTKDFNDIFTAALKLRRAEDFEQFRARLDALVPNEEIH